MLWWGRSDPHYSRNRIVRALLADSGWRVVDFRPLVSAAGGAEAALRGLPRPDVVWVPAFRQRDLAAAARWCEARGVPLVADPLISAYDKQVNERSKHAPDSAAAQRLKRWEARRLGRARRVIADTGAHAAYLAEVLGVRPDRLRVVPVGAEEARFPPQPWRDPVGPPEVLFYGSFIGLQAPQVVVEAARIYRGPPVRWTLLGHGPLLARCRETAAGVPAVSFEPWVPYERLAGRIGAAHLLLGIFGDSGKAGRVIPNKVYQACACARAVVTRAAAAYADLVGETGHGLHRVPPADPAALAARVASLAADPAGLRAEGALARATYERLYSAEAVRRALDEALDGLVSPA